MNLKRTLIITVYCGLLLSGCAAAPKIVAGPINPDDGLAPDYIDHYTGIEFKLLPAGSFTMGSPESETERDRDEGPVHFVTIDAFYMGKYEVTQAQWERVMGANTSHNKSASTLPVENVAWNTVQKFLKKLQKKTGLPYRLPTEAEWEYACRAGTQTSFFSGSDNKTLNEYAWFDMNAGGETHPVGTRLPNTWGLYDMHGNVSEWVADGRRGYLSRPAHNPRGPLSQLYAIHRGGCFIYPARLCRSANRMTYEKNIGTHIIGFRLALDKDAVKQK